MMISIVSLSIRIIVIIFSIFILSKILSNTDLLTFSNLFSYQNAGLFLVVAVSLIGSVLIRSVRWQFLVYSQIEKRSLKQCFSDFWNYLFSLVLNLLIPFRFGEIYRILSSGGVKKSLVKNTMSAFIEKFFDVFVVFGGLLLYIFVFGITFLQGYKQIVSNGMIVLASFGFVILLLFSFYTGRHHLNHRFKTIGKNLAINKKYSFWLIIFMMTCVAWMLEALKFFLVWYCLGNSIETTLPLLAFLLATLSLGIPGAPAALGTFHYAVIVATIPYGTDYGVALNYAVIVHLSYFLILVFCSIFLYIFTGPPIGFKETNLRQVILKFKSGWAS